MQNLGIGSHGWKDQDVPVHQITDDHAAQVFLSLDIPVFEITSEINEGEQGGGEEITVRQKGVGRSGRGQNLADYTGPFRRAR